MNNRFNIAWQKVKALPRRVAAELDAAWGDLMVQPWKLALTLAVAIIALLLYGFSAALLWAVFLAFLFYEFDTRLLGAAAILCLTACPVLLATGADWGNAWAEAIAVYAFFFLVMTVTLQMIDFKRHPEEYSE